MRNAPILLTLLAAVGAITPAVAQQEVDHRAYILDLVPTVLDIEGQALDLVGSDLDLSSDTLDLSDTLMDLVERSEGLSMRQEGDVMILSMASDVLFEFDSAALTKTARQSLTEVAGVISQTEGGPIEVVGHTDSKGSDAYNMELSRQRAASVAAWLTENGIAADRLKQDGRGESQPVADNETSDGKDNPDGRALNRRVEFVFPGDLTVTSE